ncbi:alpha-L-fucosidase [candidate division KSB1 bacterium]|nr:alpha-L-fucosidase [candidate division KSB1 bacterium]
MNHKIYCPTKIIILVLSIMIINCSESRRTADDMQPLLPIPAPQQLAWQQDELIMFIHFGMNTFNDVEWGDGTEDPAKFNPANLDARQWVRVAQETGFKTVILTAKHHDGFCLWQSEFSEHSVKNSPWKNGQGDVVREFTDACREFDVKAGLYLSPWERHEPTYGDSPRYNQFYMNQLTELLSNYGDVAEVWFDGACAEGPNGNRQVYDWQGYYALIRKLQPEALIAISGPDIRWVGNESGVARETEWSVQPPSPAIHAGMKDPVWYPAECDVSIRPGWFWHASEDTRVKSLEHLLDIYFKSVGRNSALLLNVPPNDKGVFAEPDSRRLKEFRVALDAIFKTNLAESANFSASNVRGDQERYAPQNTVDADPETFWAADDSVTNSWLELDFGHLATFNISMLKEKISLGQRVEAYRIDALADGAWLTIARGTTIGHKKLDRFQSITARKLRIVIEKSRACPTLKEIGIYRAQNCIE